MHKSTLILLLSLAICMLAINEVHGSRRMITEFDDVESQMSIYPENDEETAALEGSKILFTDFCLTTRDNVMGDIKRTTKNLASSVFSLFFKSFETLGLASLYGGENRQEKPVAHAPDEQTDEAAKQTVTKEEQSTPQQEQVQKPRSIYRTVIGALSATKDAVTNNVVQTLSTIKSQLGLKTISVALRDTCNKVGKFQEELNDRFERTKSEIGSSDLAALTVDDLQCVTTGRVLKFDRFCKMVMAAQEPVTKMIG